MPLINELPNATSYVQFSENIIISPDLFGEVIRSVTITKSPSSTGGAPTSTSYNNLSIALGNGPSQNFLTTNTVTFSNLSQETVTLRLNGMYTDYMFSKTIRYYYNPNNVPLTGTNSVTKYSASVTRTVPDSSASPSTNSYLSSQISSSTVSTAENVPGFYYTKHYWTDVPNPVNSIIEFFPYTGGPNETYFSYQISVGYDNTFPLFGNGGDTSNFTLYHGINYNREYDTNIFNQRLNSQTGG